MPRRLPSNLQRRRFTTRLAGPFALALALCSCGGAPASSSTAASDTNNGFDGAALPARGPTRDFTLTDQSGARVSLSRYRGRVVIVSFLYPTCGSVCVLIAEQIRGALDELERPVPVLIVSAEPAADSAANVRRFLAQVQLDGRALYLGGTRAQLQPIWRAFHVRPASAGAAQFSSYAGVMLIDRAGVERDLFETEELTPEALSHDVRKLEAE